MLGEGGPDADAGRLDLAAELMGVDGRVRVALELAVVTAIDPGTAQAARVLAGRLGYSAAADVGLLDELLTTVHVGSGLLRALSESDGALRTSGALQRDGERLRVSRTLAAFLDGSPAAGLPRAHGDGLPPAALQALATLRQGWVETLASALSARRPLLVSATAGGGLPSLAGAVAAHLGVPLRLIDGAALWQRDDDGRSDGLAALGLQARLWPELIAVRGIEVPGAALREEQQRATAWLTALCELDRPLLMLHEGPVAPDLGALCAIAGGVAHVELPAAEPEERERLLQVALTAAGVPEDEALRLAVEVRHYGLALGQVGVVAAATMQRAGARVGRLAARGELPDGPPVVMPSIAELRVGVLAATSARLRQYGSRVETNAGWDDLVLPEETLDAVRTVARFARLRGQLFDDWGFRAKMPYGRALSAMFSGPSGTGKTMVAGLCAKDLGVELYRVDLGRLVSKYVGETEERLGALFDEATQSGAALLFDEADSLFGQRTEIKSSNDRYANLEVNYLLQRLEDFDGLVFLTTNFGSSIDEAFLRRIRFRISFPLPTQTERARLWQVMLPKEMPLDEDGDPADWDWLGESFELSGGHIRNGVLRAAMLAADAGRSVGMRHLYDAAAAEYRELGKLAPPYPFDEDW